MASSVNGRGALHIPSLAAALPNGWTWCRLEDACKGVFDCPHSTPVIIDDGPFLARSQDIRAGVFRFAQAARVSEETYAERIRRAEPRYGDLLYSREGTYFGLAAEVPRNMRVCLGQRMVLIRPDPTIFDARYLKYWLNSPILASHVAGHRDGTVAERLNMPTIRALPVVAAPLKEQRRISEILGTLDDKIELNRRMNETLEAMGRAIFKSWFVDFDPVRAKAEGRQPAGMDAATAALFPVSFEDSPLGKIPQGWSVLPFAGTVEVLGGGTPKTSVPQYWNGNIPWFSVVDAPADSDVWVISTEKNITTEGLNNCSANLLPRGTTIISARGTVGRVALVSVPMAMNQSCYGLRGRTGEFGFFTYFTTRQLVAELRQRSHGSVFDTITRETLRGVQVAAPPKAIAQSFEQLVLPFLDRICVALIESQSLTRVREALLPKLLSGEIRVPEAEKLVEATTNAHTEVANHG